MCLITNQSKPLIAENDITCFKILTVSNYILFKKFSSPIQFFNWKFNKVYDANLAIMFKHDHKEVDDGFHAFIKNDNTINSFEYRFNYLLNKKTIIVEALIPSGSNYYTSIDGTEIVSNKMKLIRVIKDPKLL